jgi:NAD(P)-dependent dehydrogenase (short-subunit alcohol dehydrogenase family)
VKKVLLITGASSGVGASLVHRFAGEYDQIIAAARRVDRMRSEFADLPGVTPVALDVSDPDGLTAFAQGLVAEHGVVPFVVSCAGAWNAKPFLETTDEEFEYGWRVDALAHAVLLRELVPAMREHDFGRFVVFSGGGTLMPTSGWSVQYGAIMACNGYTVSAALEARDRNVKINLTDPGAANTEMYPGPLSPTACHDTVAWLLDLDADGPTGRFFWMGAELPIFPDLTGLRYEEGIAPAEQFTPFERIQGNPVQREAK